MNRRRAAQALTALSALTLLGSCGPSRSEQAVEPTAARTTSTSAAPPTDVPPTVVTGTEPGTTVSVTTGDPTAPTTVDPLVTVAPKKLRLALVEIASVDSPTAFAARHGDPTLFVTSQPGIVHALRDGAAPVTVLDITADTRSGGEQGLLGLAFSSDGSTAYIHRTIDDGSIEVLAFSVGTDGVFDVSSRRVVLTIPHPGEANHNGGSLVIGPDGMLYIGLGDGGGSGDPSRNAQNLTSLLGKILRIDPAGATGTGYSIPADNPFYAMDSKRNEIWAYGLRNPWRFSFDRLTGDLWIGDVGQNTTEEIDLVRAADGGGRGANFGWSAFEGTERFNKDQDAPNKVNPLFTYPHKGESASVTGGFVYRGGGIPEMYGAYVFGDAVRGTLWALRTNGANKPVVAEVGSVESVSSFGEDNNGELYALSFGRGTVYRIVRAD